MLPKLLESQSLEPEVEKYCKFVVGEFGDWAEPFLTKFPFIQSLDGYRREFGDASSKEIIAAHLSQDSFVEDDPDLLSYLPDLPLSSSDELLTGLLIASPGFFMFGASQDALLDTPPPSPGILEDSNNTTEPSRYCLDKCRPIVFQMHDYCSRPPPEPPCKKKRGRPRLNRPPPEPTTAIWRSIKASVTSQKRGRPKKQKIQYVPVSSSSDSSSSDSDSEISPTTTPSKKKFKYNFPTNTLRIPKRGRPRKNPVLIPTPKSSDIDDQDIYVDIMSPPKKCLQRNYHSRPFGCSSLLSSVSSTSLTLLDNKGDSLSEDELIVVND